MKLSDISLYHDISIDAVAEAAFLTANHLENWSQFTSTIKKQPALHFMDDDVDNADWTKGRILATGQIVARNLMELPSNDLTPESFARFVESYVNGSGEWHDCLLADLMSSSISSLIDVEIRSVFW